ncbi:MAG: hypothetical protein KKB65_05165 [Nanoarchaeota archaeon]|nr:hypothetical protein [Nanoarchaeota archaeon]MBU1030598.1 hypothetical protein [Nanoarchaeota archaeon]MBU1849714.1 hypothetical protein [Nanoarchaeota archaeon]
MKKEIEIRFEKVAYEKYHEIILAVETNKSSRSKPNHESILNSINQKLDKLKLNPYAGDLISRKHLSKRTINFYGTDQLFKTSLIVYWRLIYTLIGEEAKIIVFILEYVNHEIYNKRFGYKKR